MANPEMNDQKPRKRLIATLLTFGLALGAVPALSAATSSGDVRVASADVTPSAQQTSDSADVARPMIWHLVIRIALTKAGCENIRRIMPNSGSLKCVKAGKVWVLIPKGMGW
ncbi:hypothetical protein SAMN06893096_103154 [Geodermatophilus pulveris]|uniref:Uncharacterized protein n=1 Tax=Geodermatophilus pulveris TaxID=1564159 RepID=A0A239DGJ2_9ACTN|nr:hypothetical protein [Geodermatophilus pulveris]SNS30883.1 hypothetical protein SAMN06893096_103154 [Geodermatophilus pulveris]